MKYVNPILVLMLSLFFPLTTFAGTSINASPSNTGAFGTAFNPTVTCDANYPKMWAFYRDDTGARIGSDAESDLTGLNCNGALSSMLGSSMDSIFGSGGGTVTALYFDSNSETNCLGGTHDLTDCEADPAYTGQGSHSYDFILTAGGGGGGGGATTTTATSSDLSTVDGAEQNLANGFMIFLASMVAVIWMLRRPRT